MKYFAYGSNMYHKSMRERCPGSRYIGRAHLEDYKFVYDGYSHSREGAVANIVECDRGGVWGGLYEISGDCLNALDRFEGYPRSYNRKEIEVKENETKSYRAWVYYRLNQAVNEPQDRYRQIVKEGAHNCGLRQEYIEKNL